MIPKKALLAGLVTVALAFFTASAGPALARISAKAAKNAVESIYKVKVLKVREAEIEGRKVYILTVMNPGGDFNEAFQVNTLVIDAETGAEVSQFRHKSSGYTLPATRSRGLRQPVDALRGSPWR